MGNVVKYFWKKHALSLCRLIRWAFHTSETWLLSNNLISQMEKQHLLSCSFTYGYRCCLGKLKQVAHVKKSLWSAAVSWERITVVCCEGTVIPKAGKVGYLINISRVSIWTTHDSKKKNQSSGCAFLAQQFEISEDSMPCLFKGY